MPFSLRLMCALHYGLGLLNAVWTAFFAWVLGQAMWQLAPRPWVGYNAWDKLFFITGPLLLVLGVTAVGLNLMAPGWIERRERFAACRGLSLLNLVPLFSFFGFGLPVALYALWIYRHARVRAWFEPTAEGALTADRLPELPLLQTPLAGRAGATATVRLEAGSTASRRRTTQLLTAAAR